MAEEVIVLTGIKETLDALKEFDKDAVKRFNKVINSELSSAENSARNIVARVNNGSGTGTPMAGTAGTINTGGGAGGGSAYAGPGAAGGSGVVILSYIGTQRGTGGIVTSSGGYTIHTFTSSGTYVA
jgi:hypothetical protein